MRRERNPCSRRTPCSSTSSCSCPSSSSSSSASTTPRTTSDGPASRSTGTRRSSATRTSLEALVNTLEVAARRGRGLDDPGHAAGHRPGHGCARGTSARCPRRSSCCPWSRPRSSWASACCSSSPSSSRPTARWPRSPWPTSPSASRTWRSSCERGRISLDPHVEEAARDLGASALGAFRYVTLPLLLPAIAAGAMLAFALSFDDLIVTAFNAGPGSSTLPLYLYSRIKFGVTPGDQRHLDDHRGRHGAWPSCIAWRFGQTRRQARRPRRPRTRPTEPAAGAERAALRQLRVSRAGWPSWRRGRGWRPCAPATAHRRARRSPAACRAPTSSMGTQT